MSICERCGWQCVLFTSDSLNVQVIVIWLFFTRLLKGYHFPQCQIYFLPWCSSRLTHCLPHCRANIFLFQSITHHWDMLRRIETRREIVREDCECGMLSSCGEGGACEKYREKGKEGMACIKGSDYTWHSLFLFFLPHFSWKPCI